MGAAHEDKKRASISIASRCLVYSYCIYIANTHPRALDMYSGCIYNPRDEEKAR